jgi:hypothetical protein
LKAPPASVEMSALRPPVISANFFELVSTSKTADGAAGMVTSWCMAMSRLPE